MVSPEMAMIQQREQMVTRQIEGRGIQDPLVLAAMREVPREAFIDKKYESLAYDDGPLPILEGQTISQPYVVALMTELLNLKPDDRVLEIGTGSGYAAAVLSRVAAFVYSVERLDSLVQLARKNLKNIGYNNVFVHHSDGTLGWIDHAPYDAIVVAAGGPRVPGTLKEQLAHGGRLVMPVGREQRSQRLVKIIRQNDETFDSRKLSHVRFVPLIGKKGWEKEDRRWLDIF